MSIPLYESIEEMEAYAEDMLNEAGGMLTIRHMFNRLATAKLSNTTLTNTRSAIERTVKGTDNLEDLQYLRRDLSMGVNTLTKRLQNAKTDEEREDIKKHLNWLRSEYPAMLTQRAKEIRSNENGTK